jgi:hypothetical protein
MSGGGGGGVWGFPAPDAVFLMVKMSGNGGGVCGFPAYSCHVTDGDDVGTGRRRRRNGRRKKRSLPHPLGRRRRTECVSWCQWR